MPPSSLAPVREDHERRGGDEDAGDGEDALHGPGSTRLGSQSRVPSMSRKGAEPSGGGWEAAPGQRRTWPVCSPSRRWLGGIGVSVPPAGLSLNE